MYTFAHLFNNILLSVAAVLFINDSLLLFIRGKNNRARRMMGMTTLIWGMMYLLYAVSSFYGAVNYPILSAGSLISSHFFICVMFLFPLEVLLPGWVTLKRSVLLLTPIIVLSIIYGLGLKLTGQEMEDFFTFPDLLSAFPRFNVWYRLLFFTCNVIYLVVLMDILRKREVKYIKWQNENYSDLDSVDISWIRYYRHMMILIVTCYLLVVFWGDVWSIIIHTLVVIVTFSILFYKGMFYENPYSEVIISDSELQPKPSFIEEKLLNHADTSIPLNDTSFMTKLPAYVAKLTLWMEEEKPFLHKDFKLVDAARILPLNRSYLSRVFNEGYNQNFSEVVRMYRINYAKKVINEQPHLTMYKVAELSGFTSDTTFIRAFQKVTGMTPKQYKER